MNPKVTLSRPILFVILMSVVNLLAYALIMSGANLFQHYIFLHHLDANTYNLGTLFSLLILIGILALNLLTKFQEFIYQRILIALLILIILVLPVSLTTFPILSGCSNDLSNLAQAWTQLFVPTTLRGLITGVITALTGVIDIRSTTIESLWTFALHRERIIALILVLCLFFFWQTTKNLKNDHRSLETQADTIGKLIIKYSYIFLGCIFVGFNGGLFFNTFNLGLALFKETPKTYQYIIYLGSIASPIMIGLFADKFGIIPIFLSTALGLISCELLSALFAFYDFAQPIHHYIIAFMEAGCAASLYSLIYALIGEKLRTKGFFRSFSISVISLNMGTFLSNLVYVQSYYSFVLTKLVIALINVLLFTILWFSYKKAVPAH